MKELFFPSVIVAFCFVVIIIASVQSCTFFQPLNDELHEAVEQVCEKDYRARVAIIEQVNIVLAPNKLVIYCDGDPQPTPPAGP
jgi:hypothetical protein